MFLLILMLNGHPTLLHFLVGIMFELELMKLLLGLLDFLLAILLSPSNQLQLAKGLLLMGCSLEFDPSHMFFFVLHRLFSNPSL